MAREGPALLQGLVVCGQCGRRLSPRYVGEHGAIVWYECNWRRRELESKTRAALVQALQESPRVLRQWLEEAQR